MRSFSFSLHQGWFFFFCLWSLFLTGFFEWFHPQHRLSPGISQIFQLRSYLAQKQAQLAEVQAEIEVLKREKQELTHLPFAQEREIRAVLGYIAPDERILEGLLPGTNSQVSLPQKERPR